MCQWGRGVCVCACVCVCVCARSTALGSGNAPGSLDPARAPVPDQIFGPVGTDFASRVFLTPACDTLLLSRRGGGSEDSLQVSWKVTLLIAPICVHEPHAKLKTSLGIVRVSPTNAWA